MDAIEARLDAIEARLQQCHRSTFTAAVTHLSEKDLVETLSDSALLITAPFFPRILGAVAFFHAYWALLLF